MLRTAPSGILTCGTVLLCCFTFFLASAQDCHLRLKGTVIDGETHLPFQGVSIGIKDTPKGTLTDSLGRFELSNLCKGNYTLLVSSLGYKSFSATYSLTHDIEERILLHTDTCSLPSVTIVGTKEEQLASFTKSSLGAKDLEKLSGLSLGDALKELPGVTTFRTGTSISKPVIHGLYGNRIVIINAGLRQEGQQWGNEHAPEIDPFLANKLTVIKGAAGVRYGSDAIAGVILVEPKPLPTESEINGAVSIAGFSNNRQGTSSAMLEGRFWEKFPIVWRLQGTLKKAGNTKTPHYYQANTGFEERNFSYTLGLDKKGYGAEMFYSQFNTELGIFSAADIGNKADIENAIRRSEPIIKSDFSYNIRRPFQKVEHELFRAKAWWNVFSLGKLSALFGRQFNDRSEFDILRSSVENAKKDNPQLHYKLTTHNAELIFDHSPFKKLTGSAGLTYTQQANIWEGRFLIPNFKSHGYGIFLLERWQKHRLTLEAGLRFDTKQLTAYFNEKGVISSDNRAFQNGCASVGAVFQIHHHLNWKTNVGSTWRPPTVNELYSNGLHQGTASIEYGDKTLQPEQGYKGVTSLEASSKKLGLEITGYYNLIQNYIYLKPNKDLVQTVRGAYPTFTYTQTDARLLGSDLSVDYSFTSALSLIGKGSLVFAKDVKTNQYLVNIPPVRYSLTLKFAPQKGSFAQKNEPYASITCLRVERQTRVEDSSDYAAPPSAYTLMDAEIGMSFRLGKQKITTSLQVTNAFDIAYRDYMNRFRYYTDEMGRNISIRIKVPFQIYTPKTKTL